MGGVTHSTEPTRSVAERLADTPAVAATILRAAAAARRRIAGHATDADAYALAHSWVITGAPGSGRSEAAVAFAAALECTDPDEIGCGRCDACRGVFEGAHTDVEFVRPQGLVIPVKYVTEVLLPAAHTLPTVGKWRVVIIDNADRLNKESANALLKTVEEPPARTIILFCAPSTDPLDFIVTLRSRCRHLYVPSPSAREVARILVAEEGASEQDAQLAAHASLRHIGRARRLVTSPEMQRRRAQVLNVAELIAHREQGFQAMGALVKSVDKEVDDTWAEADAAEVAALERSLGVGARGKGAQKAVRGAAGQVKDLEKEIKRRATRRRRDLLDLSLVDLAGLYRDALLLAIGSDVAPIHPDFAPLAAELAENVGETGLLACLDAIQICRQQISVNVNPTIATDALVGRLRMAYRVN
ncbi:DNA polymerase III subunit delta' [Corynebacterium renale]|uniref:DNA polymerase-3 subunit delta n=1 Tax=Corynebacterium renale TaxID=1724 RepID=A0A2A9DM37_9CORY|nr:DNA polymerase-3 subunit delta' [Corynebacterium renale]SQI23402.1 DNA polymerase III subunit delta' [Corynebacterium renale]